MRAFGLAALVASLAAGGAAGRSDVTPGGLREHLAALQRIADRTGGTRAVGTPGYDASVAYVAGRLREAGYQPRLDRFALRIFRETAPPELVRVRPRARRFRRGRDFLTLV